MTSAVLARLSHDPKGATPTTLEETHRAVRVLLDPHLFRRLSARATDENRRTSTMAAIAIRTFLEDDPPPRPTLSANQAVRG
jgi:hypothetical protein